VELNKTESAADISPVLFPSNPDLSLPPIADFGSAYSPRMLNDTLRVLLEKNKAFSLSLPIKNKAAALQEHLLKPNRV